MEIRKVVKGFTGYRDLKNNEDFSHVIYDKDAYDKQINKINFLENAIKEKDKEIEFIESRCRYEISSIEIEAENEINNIKENSKKEILKYKNETIEQINLNTNLKRICRENANSKRNIKNKKQHIGYILLSCDEASINYKVYKNNYEELNCWINKMQTPFNSLLEYENVKKLFENEFSELQIILKIEHFYYNHVFNEKYFLEDIWRKNKKNNNFIFKSKYRLNAIKGFWEVEFWTKYKINITEEILP